MGFRAFVAFGDFVCNALPTAEALSIACPIESALRPCRAAGGAVLFGPFLLLVEEEVPRTRGTVRP